MRKISGARMMTSWLFLMHLLPHPSIKVSAFTTPFDSHVVRAPSTTTSSSHKGRLPNQGQMRLQCFSLYSTTAGGHVSSNNPSQSPRVILQGPIPPSDLPTIIQALSRVGFDTSWITPNNYDSDEEHPQNTTFYTYQFVRATGMLKLISSPSVLTDAAPQPPQPPPSWIPMVSDMEHVLSQNGWSFLDPDESEALSAFDVDAANEEGLYQPQWGQQQQQQQEGEVLIDAETEWTRSTHLSKLGYSLEPWTKDQILEYANSQLNNNEVAEQTRRVLLEGATDVPHIKMTHNGVDLSGSVKDRINDSTSSDMLECAIGGLPVFAMRDLSPTTAGSGWLSFVRPRSDDHVILVSPPPGATDQRVEVLCARTRCHLGHYFGRSEGYCINASALNYKASTAKNTDDVVPVTETILLGAGCFWHVEFSLQRLQGVLSTQVGYAGGTITSRGVTYEEVCQGQTGHAEVVHVRFDPRLLPPKILLDCFLAMHDPTKTRAHGKHAKGTGQYRSCIIVDNSEMQMSAKQCLDECQRQLGKELSTELIMVPRIKDPENTTVTGPMYFHLAEERHQKHDEKRQRQSNGCMDDSTTTQLDPLSWLGVHGKRSKSIIGSSETVQ